MSKGTIKQMTKLIHALSAVQQTEEIQNRVLHLSMLKSTLLTNGYQKPIPKKIADQNKTRKLKRAFGRF
jgi:hypothetical protein